MNSGLATGRPATFGLLCRCARTHLTADSQEQIEALVRKGVDWEALEREASFHGVQPLLYDCLLETCAAVLPPQRRAVWGLYLAHTAAANVYYARELVRVLQLLADAGIRSLALKGPVLAVRAYGGVERRSFTDLDILISPDDFERAEACLLGGGYAAFDKLAELSPARKRLYVWQTRQYPYISEDDFFTLDIHVGIMPPLYYFPLSFEALWERSEEVELVHRSVRCLEPEDTLLILCYHGEKNGWGRLTHTCDVAELLHAMPHLDWTAIWERARQLRGERVVHLGLLLAHERLGAPLPPDVRDRVYGDRHVRQLERRLAGHMPRRHDQDGMSFGERMRFHLTLQRTAATKTRYLLHALLRRMRDVE